ncbi:MAG TPA: tetratricopeptide repeat protein, partial [Pirellulales bacterium]
MLTGAIALTLGGFGTATVARAQQAASPAGAAARQFAEATGLQNQEQFDKAADAWQVFLKEHPSDPRADRAWHHLGVCRLKNKQYAEAQAAFERLIADQPKSALASSAWLNLGLAQYDQAAAGQTELYAKAAETFVTLLEKFPRSNEVSRALFYRAESLYAQSKNAEAAKLYADFIRKYPQDPLLADALYAQGVALQELGSHAAAGASYDAWLKQFADHAQAAEVIFRRGETLLAQGNSEAAEKWFASAAARPSFALADLALLRQAACL